MDVRILVVEDSEITRRMIRAVLETRDWTICGEAENGLAGVKRSCPSYVKSRSARAADSLYAVRYGRDYARRPTSRCLCHRLQAPRPGPGGNDRIRDERPQLSRSKYPVTTHKASLHICPKAQNRGGGTARLAYPHSIRKKTACKWLSKHRRVAEISTRSTKSKMSSL